MKRTQSGSNCCACSALHGIEEQERERYCRTHGGGQECGLLRANNENEVMLGVCVCYYCSSAVRAPFSEFSASITMFAKSYCKIQRFIPGYFTKVGMTMVK